MIFIKLRTIILQTKETICIDRALTSIIHSYHSVTLVDRFDDLENDTLNTFQLRFVEHSNYVLPCCGQRLYSLKTLRGQGLSHGIIITVFQSLMMSGLVYALSTWVAA
jgi:hypothetical protein